MSLEVLERKIAAVITLLAEELVISEVQALDYFYSTQTYNDLVNSATDLHLRSDGYIVEEVLAEKKCGMKGVVQ